MEAPKLEIKSLPSRLRYVFFSGDVAFSVTIAADLNGQQVEFSVVVLKRIMRASEWNIAYITGIPPCNFCYKIKLTRDYKPSIGKKNLNPPLQKVVKK